MGLFLLGAMSLYLLVSIVVVTGVIGHARETGQNARPWGWGAALVMYLIPFWDWIPTVAMHQYYCATEAGFWVYKTPEQWKKENPGVIDTLVARKITVPAKSEGDEDNWIHVFELNQRINKTTQHRGPLFLHRWGYESTVVDTRTNEVLARIVDFYTAHERSGGGWRGWKFWLALDHCSSSGTDSKRYGDYLSQIKGVPK